MADYVDDNMENIDFSDDNAEIAVGNDLTISYSYPDNPADAIRSWLQEEANKRSLPIEIGDIRQTENDMGVKEEFTVRFTNHSNNACVFSFSLSDYLLLDGKMRNRKERYTPILSSKMYGITWMCFMVIHGLLLMFCLWQGAIYPSA